MQKGCFFLLMVLRLTKSNTLQDTYVYIFGSGSLFISFIISVVMQQF